MAGLAAPPRKDHRMLRYLVAVLAAATLAAPAAPHSHKAKSLEIVHPFTLQTQKGALTARVLMTIKNAGRERDRLVSASTPRAAKVELDNAGWGSAAFIIEAGEELGLAGDGPRVMLIGLEKPLDAYDDFKMTLVFEKAGRVAIDVMVEEAQ
jgi:copper(I)-binding protein